MAKNDFQYAGWNSYTLQCGTIMTLISPGDCTLQRVMWLLNHDRNSEFIKWQHPAMWYVDLGWHAIEFARWQHPAMWQVALGLQCHVIRQNVRHIGILHLVSILPISPQSTCHSAPVCEFYPNRPTSAQKITSCRFSRWRISAILDFRGPIMCSLKSPCTTSCMSSLDIIALNSLLFEKIAFLYFGDRQTNRRTNGLSPAAA